MATQRAIPKNLFPLVDGEYNEIWAKKTFPYAHMFMNTVTSMIPNDENLELWRNRALQIRKQILDEGNKAGKEKVLSVAINKYNLFMPCNATNTIRPKCVQDVLDIIADKEWYNTNKKTRLEQIYMMMYGIKKIGFNQWAIELEQNWLRRNNVVYITRKECTDTMYNTRGCIYSTIIQIFSNTNTERFKATMLNYHNEYIFVRKKDKKKSDSLDLDIVPLQCRYGSLYLARVKRNDQRLFNDEERPITNSFRKVLQYGECWVKENLKAGVKIEQLNKQIELWAEELKDIESTKCADSGKFDCWLLY